MGTICYRYCFFSLCFLILFSCGSHQLTQQTEPINTISKSNPTKPEEKAYVLLRSDGSDSNIIVLKEVLYSNFIVNNISTYIVDYPLGKPWNNNQIFTTAYEDNYDYILLIDQVAKFTIDNKTNVGGKYQIRSYPLKSSNPDWIDLGQLTCNISIKPSINKFVNQILKNIAPNNHIVNESVLVSNQDERGSFQKTANFNSSLKSELAELKRQLEIEKQKTLEVLVEKEKLEQHFNSAIKEEQEKTKKALAELELAKTKKQERLAMEATERLKEQQKQKQLEDESAAKVLAEQLKAERLAKLKEEQEAQVLAEAIKIKEEQILAKQLEAERLALLERQQKEAKIKKERKEKVPLYKPASDKAKDNNNSTKQHKGKTKSKTDKTRALVLVRTKPDDFDNLKKLEYNIEFDFMFAKATAKTKIMDKESILDKTDLVLQNQLDYDIFIIVDQLGYKGDGFSEYQISSYNTFVDNTWKASSKHSYNLTDSNSLKALSKSIVSNL